MFKTLIVLRNRAICIKIVNFLCQNYKKANKYCKNFFLNKHTFQLHYAPDNYICETKLTPSLYAEGFKNQELSDCAINVGIYFLYLIYLEKNKFIALLYKMPACTFDFINIL